MSLPSIQTFDSTTTLTTPLTGSGAATEVRSDDEKEAEDFGAVFDAATLSVPSTQTCPAVPTQPELVRAHSTQAPVVSIILPTESLPTPGDTAYTIPPLSYSAPESDPVYTSPTQSYTDAAPSREVASATPGRINETLTPLSQSPLSQSLPAPDADVRTSRPAPLPAAPREAVEGEVREVGKSISPAQPESAETWAPAEAAAPTAWRWDLNDKQRAHDKQSGDVPLVRRDTVADVGAGIRETAPPEQKSSERESLLTRAETPSRGIPRGDVPAGRVKYPEGEPKAAKVSDLLMSRVIDRIRNVAQDKLPSTDNLASSVPVQLSVEGFAVKVEDVRAETVMSVPGREISIRAHAASATPNLVSEPPLTSVMPSGPHFASSAPVRVEDEAVPAFAGAVEVHAQVRLDVPLDTAKFVASASETDNNLSRFLPVQLSLTPHVSGEKPETFSREASVPVPETFDLAARTPKATPARALFAESNDPSVNARVPHPHFRLLGLIRNTQQAGSFVETTEPAPPQTQNIVPPDAANEQTAAATIEKPSGVRTNEPAPAPHAQAHTFEPPASTQELADVSPLVTRLLQRRHAPPTEAPETREIAPAEEAPAGTPQTQAAPSEAPKLPTPQTVAHRPEPVTAQVAHHFVAEAATLKPREPRTLRVSLRPDELGRVEVELSRDDEGRLTARLTAETEAAQRLLSGGLEQLRQTLESTGLQVERLDVSVGTGAQQQQAGQTGGGARGGESFHAGHHFGPDDTHPTVMPGGVTDEAERLISLRA